MSHLKRMGMLLPDFEDVLRKRKKEGQNNMSRRLFEEIFEEEEWGVEDDDSEVETENEESYERAHLQTQENDLKKLKQGFKEKWGKIFLLLLKV